MSKEIRTLRADEIEVKVKQIAKAGAFALLYKTARTDMSILDEVFGPDNWTDDYKEIKGNLYCGIAVYMGEPREWVWRWDCGIESREDDGNEKKGEASDAFKRAGTRWGIGRELYTAPTIFLRVPTKEVQGKAKTVYVLENKYARFEVKSIEYDDKRRIIGLEITDEKGATVYRYPQQGAKSGDSGTKAQSASKQPSEARTAAQSYEEQLKAAMAMEMTIKNSKYKLGEMSQEQLLYVKNNAKVEKFQEAAALVLRHRFQKQMQESVDDDLPF